jgi:hypothetical protein
MALRNGWLGLALLPIAVLLSGVITPAQAADGNWLDQYNVLLYVTSA